MNTLPKKAIVIGAGPAGLMAAETLNLAGVSVAVYDAMPSAGRKFLMAGKGGMNITHAEPFSEFLLRYGHHQADLSKFLQAFSPNDLRAWLSGLGIDTFVGSSGRVFPSDMKAAPLLRAWLHRLRTANVRFFMRHDWKGWNSNGFLLFTTHEQDIVTYADVVILALGGASWPQLGSTGKWTTFLNYHHIQLIPFSPSNCGFNVEWSDYLIKHCAGKPIKPLRLFITDSQGRNHYQNGELVISDYGLEGGAIYALSGLLRDEIALHGSVRLFLDLAPDLDLLQISERLALPRGKLSLTNFFRKRLGFDAVKFALLREVLAPATLQNPSTCAAAIKSLPIRLVSPRSISEAISSAGGVAFCNLDENLMLKNLPGVFCAGEMLDWEAPTGGYLLSACFATGRAAGMGAIKWLQNKT